MSNFFTRSKDDMKYLFKNKEELSKKERKRKRRGWGTLIGLILVLIQLIVSGLLLFNIFKLDILPLKCGQRIFTADIPVRFHIAVYEGSYYR